MVASAPAIDLQPECRLEAALAAVGQRSALASALNCALLTACVRRADCLERVSDLIEQVRGKGS